VRTAPILLQKSPEYYADVAESHVNKVFQFYIFDCMVEGLLIFLPKCVTVMMEWPEEEEAVRHFSMSHGFCNSVSVTIVCISGAVHKVHHARGEGVREGVTGGGGQEHVISHIW